MISPPRKGSGEHDLKAPVMKGRLLVALASIHQPPAPFPRYGDREAARWAHGAPLAAENLRTPRSLGEFRFRVVLARPSRRGRYKNGAEGERGAHKWVSVAPFR
jgi:hypothetical protein